MTATLATTESKDRELQDELLPNRPNSKVHRHEFVKLRWLINGMLLPAIKLMAEVDHRWQDCVREAEGIRKQVNRVIRSFKRPGSSPRTYAGGVAAAQAQSKELVQQVKDARNHVRNREPKNMHSYRLEVAKRKTALFESIDQGV